MPQGKGSSANLDALAREKGFPSYAAWKAWTDKYRKPITNVQKKQPVRNFFQNLIANAPHQGTIINKVAGRVQKVNEGMKKP